MRQMFQALYGVADTLWVALTIASYGVSACGAVVVIELIPVGVSSDLTAGLSARMAHLLGEGGATGAARYMWIMCGSHCSGVILPCCVIPHRSHSSSGPVPTNTS
jgi:Na+-driven multidrug efflux pump